MFRFVGFWKLSERCRWLYTNYGCWVGCRMARSFTIYYWMFWYQENWFINYTLFMRHCKINDLNPQEKSEKNTDQNKNKVRTWPKERSINCHWHLVKSEHFLSANSQCSSKKNSYYCYCYVKRPVKGRAQFSNTENICGILFWQQNERQLVFVMRILIEIFCVPL